MAIYDLYGSMSDDIEEAKKSLESALGIQFDARESDYQGGVYFQWGRTIDEHFVLKHNIDPIDNEPAEISFPNHKVLFYINDTVRSADLQKRMSYGVMDFFLLRHEDLA